MIDRTAAAKSKPSLNGMVFCARCGSEMADTGQRYYCPNTTVEAGSSCNVRPTDAQGLLGSVVARMVDRLATEETVQRVTDTIREITDAGGHRMRMERSEARVCDENAHRLNILQIIEEWSGTHENLAPVLKRGTGPAYEAMTSRDELDKAEFISDEQGIREAVADPGTYLGGNGDEETQELLELLVGKVLVDSESAKIIYKEALPLDGHPEGIREDLVELGPTAAG